MDSGGAVLAMSRNVRTSGASTRKSKQDRQDQNNRHKSGREPASAKRLAYFATSPSSLSTVMGNKDHKSQRQRSVGLENQQLKVFQVQCYFTATETIRTIIRDGEPPKGCVVCGPCLVTLSLTVTS